MCGDGPPHALVLRFAFELLGAMGDDGGWTVDFDSHSPQAALEWRGYATVRAVTILLAEGRA